MYQSIKRHPLILALIAAIIVCASCLLLAVTPAIAGDASDRTSAQSTPTAPIYAIDLQVWRDRDLLTHPKLTLPRGELAEIIVSDPFIAPDKVKVELRLTGPSGPSGISGEKKDDITVVADIFLPHDGRWRKAASPRLTVQKGTRSMREISLSGSGFTHPDGTAAQALILFVVIDDPA